MKSNWIVKKESSKDIIEQILINREVDLANKESFLSPSFDTLLSDSKLLPDFDKILNRIKKVIQKNEIVGIFADYDADGIPGAALLSKLFDILKIKYYIYIPSRDCGYGLSKEGIEYLIEKKCKLIITIDLGIRNINEALYAREKNIDLIITDHHLPADELPTAIALINPKISNADSAIRDLSGAGVIYLLCCRLHEYFPQITEKFLKWNLDLAAISTIADVVPLIASNRIIAKYGLTVLNKSKNLGISKLINNAKLAIPLNAYNIAYSIGPRINAPGRVSTPEDALKLLITHDEMEAKKLADKLESDNNDRQLLMDNLLIEAETEIKLKKLTKNNIVIISGDWNKGILGPCASKLAEKYLRPTIVFTYDKVAKTYIGSARSVNEINIIDLLSCVSCDIEKFGGHKGAAGLSVKASKYQHFCSEIIEISHKNINKNEFEKKYKIDAELNLEQIDMELYECIEKIEPFGMGNPKPIFLSRFAQIKNPKLVGKEMKHLSMYLLQKNKQIKSIYFNCNLEGKEVKNLHEVDVIYYIEKEKWNGNENLQIKVIDIDFLKDKNGK